MDKPTIEELMDDLLSMVSVSNRREDEFTPKELAVKSGVTDEAMRHRLEDLRERGLVEKRYAMVNGRKRMVYRKI